MVAKFICEVNETPEKLKRLKGTRIIYTGTCKGYTCDVINRAGHYYTNENVHLTARPDNAIGYASQRSEQYGDSPVLLVTDIKKLDKDVIFNGEYRTKSLPMGSFLPMELFTNEDGYYSFEHIEEAVLLGERLKNASMEEVQQEMADFLRLHNK